MERLVEIKNRYIGTETVSDAIYHTLYEGISTGILRPGSRLLEADLADVMKVSRTPVREAIKQLISEGLIYFSSHGNIRVKEYSVNEICEIIQALEGLRAITARTVAEVIDKATLARLKAILDSIDQLPEIYEDVRERASRRYDYDEMFHMVICEASGNSYLINFYRKLSKRMHIIQGTTRFKEMAYAYSDTADLERKELYQALVNRDMVGALTISLRHSEHAYNRMKSLIK